MAGEAIPSTVYSWMQDIARTIIEGQSTASRSLTYKRQTAETFDPTTQVNSPTYSDTTVTGTRHERFATAFGLGAGSMGGEIALGELGFQIEKRRLAFEPKSSDRIVDGTETYEVTDYGEDPASIYWFIRCRKVKA